MFAPELTRGINRLKFQCEHKPAQTTGMAKPPRRLSPPHSAELNSVKRYQVGHGQTAAGRQKFQGRRRKFLCMLHKDVGEQQSQKQRRDDDPFTCHTVPKNRASRKRVASRATKTSSHGKKKSDGKRRAAAVICEYSPAAINKDEQSTE